MAWEARGRQKYFYRTRRVNGQVQKEYLGRGPQAIEIAKAEEARQEANRQEIAEIRAIKNVVAPLEDMMSELDEGIRLLTAGFLLAANFHQHRGHWRRRRG